MRADSSGVGYKRRFLVASCLLLRLRCRQTLTLRAWRAGWRRRRPPSLGLTAILVLVAAVAAASRRCGHRHCCCCRRRRRRRRRPPRSSSARTRNSSHCRPSARADLLNLRVFAARRCACKRRERRARAHGDWQHSLTKRARALQSATRDGRQRRTSAGREHDADQRPLAEKQFMRVNIAADRLLSFDTPPPLPPSPSPLPPLPPLLRRRVERLFIGERALLVSMPPPPPPLPTSAFKADRRLDARRRWSSCK